MGENIDSNRSHHRAVAADLQVIQLWFHHQKLMSPPQKKPKHFFSFPLSSHEKPQERKNVDS